MSPEQKRAKSKAITRWGDGLFYLDWRRASRPALHGLAQQPIT
jgi:hypothetical protein